MLNVPITPPRVAFIDQRTGNISREWYMFFLSLFRTTGDSNLSLDDLQKTSFSFTNDQITELQKQINDLQIAPPIEPIVQHADVTRAKGRFVYE